MIVRSLLISNDSNIGFVDYVVVSFGVFIGNGDGDFSENRLLVKDWGGNRNCSFNRNPFENRVLNVINIVLLIVFLDNRLRGNLSGRHLNFFHSSDVIDLGRFSNVLQLYVFVIASANVQINLFLLNNWLNVGLVVELPSRFNNGFESFVFSQNGLSSEGIQINDSIF